MKNILTPKLMPLTPVGIIGLFFCINTRPVVSSGSDEREKVTPGSGGDIYYGNPYFMPQHSESRKTIRTHLTPGDKR